MSTTSPDATVSLGRGLVLDLRRLRASAPLAALLGLTGLLYLWGLSRNGYANSYYAAAVQAGTHSWKAFLFGSLDAANYITVDKPPASLWLMELSSRIFGFSSFSMLLPQALEGIASVGLLYATVRRWFGRPGALMSGLVLALTPVAALMFRFNNPDALLVLLLVAGAYALTRALEAGSTRWLALVGGLLGFAFLTKELQAFLVLPAFVLAYLVAAPLTIRRRVRQLAIAGGALLLSAGWWVALVELWPASARPYIGGSTNNSLLQLILGYNGLDRISSAGGGPGGGFSGAAGPQRLFNSIVGGQVSWLLPAAATALIAGAVWTARRPRTDHARVAVILWGGWLVVSAAVYSLMTGVIHPYYTNTLAPAIAVPVGVGATLMWRRRQQLGARLLLATMLIATAAWSYALLGRTPSWHPWHRDLSRLPLERHVARRGRDHRAADRACRSGRIHAQHGGRREDRLDAERRPRRPVDGRFSRRWAGGTRRHGPRRRHHQPRAGVAARPELISVHVGGGQLLRADRCLARVGNRQAGDGARRLHRQRPGDHTGKVQAARCERENPLLRGGRRPQWPPTRRASRRLRSSRRLPSSWQRIPRGRFRARLVSRRDRLARWRSCRPGLVHGSGWWLSRRWLPRPGPRTRRRQRPARREPDPILGLVALSLLERWRSNRL
jgi:4-amino-4-deoxy-L-arabinose transferase-like glycosyltransferase